MGEVDRRNRIAVLTVSDKGSRGERKDISGELVKELVKDLGVISEYIVVPDDFEAITGTLKTLADDSGSIWSSPRRHRLWPETSLQTPRWPCRQRSAGASEAMWQKAQTHFGHCWRRSRDQRQDLIVNSRESGVSENFRDNATSRFGDLGGVSGECAAPNPSREE